MGGQFRKLMDHVRQVGRGFPGSNGQMFMVHGRGASFLVVRGPKFPHRMTQIALHPDGRQINYKVQYSGGTRIAKEASQAWLEPSGRQSHFHTEKEHLKEESMKKLVSGAVTAALLAGLATSGIGTAQASPLPVAGANTVAPATQLTDVKYKAVRKRHYVRRHYRHYRHYGGNAAAAAAFGLFGAALAGAIASSRYDDGYYYGGGGYYPGYSYGYAAPRAYYNPGWHGGGRRFVGGGFRGGGFHGGGFHGGGFHGGGHGGGHHH
jgi:hypothetical protein